MEPETVLEKLTTRQCLFTERELHAVLKKAGVEDMTEREAAKERVLSCPECVKLYDGQGQETGLYTSTHVRAEERAILELTDRKMREAGGQVSEHARRQALSRKTLDPEQREAFEVMTAANRLCVIQGRAGAGKSYTMGAARDAFEIDGWRVVGLAPTNTVSRDMHTDGFQEASTVHAELLRQEKARTNPRSQARARELRETITARDKHQAAMEKMQPGSLDYRAAVKRLARLEGMEQEADLVLRKSCKELAETLGKETIKAEVAKVFGLEKAGVVMQRCGLEKVGKHHVRGMDYGP